MSSPVPIITMLRSPSRSLSQPPENWVSRAPRNSAVNMEPSASTGTPARPARWGSSGPRAPERMTDDEGRRDGDGERGARGRHDEGSVAGLHSASPGAERAGRTAKFVASAGRSGSGPGVTPPAAGCAPRTRAGASRDRRACTALAASSLATCSGVSFQPTAPRFWRSCSSLRAPMMTVDTVGRCSSQLSAICGTVLPVSARDRVERIDDAVEVLVGDRRADVGDRACAGAGSSRAAAGRGGSCR